MRYVFALALSVSFLLIGCEKKEESKILDKYEAWVICAEKCNASKGKGDSCLFDYGGNVLGFVLTGKGYVEQIEKGQMYQNFSEKEKQRYEQLRNRTKKIFSK